ncbi:MAG TPA: ATP-dependent DNA helicase RecG, partial [Microbacteriaceae bacterium]|nr:ATP-dependent DNA helicase RecG [Microbacteriaceae bacterium]
MTDSVLDRRLSAVLGGKTAEALESGFGMRTVADLLWHVPRRYATRGQLTPLRDLPVGENVTIVAEIQSARERRMQNRRGNIAEVVLSDGTGTLSLTFFNQAWRLTELTPGRRGVFAGKVGFYQGQRQLTHPDYELFPGDVDPDAAEKWATTPIPMYPATAKIPSWKLEKMTAIALDSLPDDLSEDDALANLTPEAAESLGVRLSLRAALEAVHRPERDGEWRPARDRLRAAEAVIMQTALLQAKAEVERAATRERHAGALRSSFDAGLPFALTPEQVSVGAEIDADLARPIPMHRLIQGEVGSGKTLVAIRAMLAVAEDGGQSALLAPTEVLAQQHFRSIVNALGPETAAAVKPVLLTGSMGAAERRKALLWLASGQSLIAVGTHALLGDAVSFADLALVIVDEQHRFGVEQRETLRSKAAQPPHTLVLTATPIPRTVAMTTFGDLDVSRIVNPPAGRPGITTHVVPLSEKPGWRDRVWQRIAEEVAAGRQAFVVAPAIDAAHVEADMPGDEADSAPAPSDAGGAAPPPRSSVEDLIEEAATHPALRSLRRAALHGRMPANDKDHVMNEFAAGRIDVLIATTVIEVGVDVPNASVMAVFDADRFGLSQLHQLRGRVGRGAVPGLCLLVTHAVPGSLARERVDALAETTDGFTLAER